MPPTVTDTVRVARSEQTVTSKKGSDGLVGVDAWVRNVFFLDSAIFTIEVGNDPSK